MPHSPAPLQRAPGFTLEQFARLAGSAGHSLAGMTVRQVPHVRPALHEAGGATGGGVGGAGDGGGRSGMGGGAAGGAGEGGGGEGEGQTRLVHTFRPLYMQPNPVQLWSHSVSPRREHCRAVSA